MCFALLGHFLLKNSDLLSVLRPARTGDVFLVRLLNFRGLGCARPLQKQQSGIIEGLTEKVVRRMKEKEEQLWATKLT